MPSRSTELAPRLALTPAILAQLEPDPDRDRLIPDLTVPGLWLRLYRTGTRTWVVRLRAPSGHRRQRALGDWPALSLPEARKAALVLLGQAAAGMGGLDPRSFRTVAEEYLAACVRPSAAPRTLKEYDRQLRTILYPAFGSRRMDSLTTDDILAVLAPYQRRPMWNRLLTGLLRPIFRYAAQRRIIATDPVSFLGKVQETPRTPRLSVTQIATLNDTLQRMRAEDRLSVRMAFAFQLLLATGARVSEILDLQWAFIDADQGSLTWPKTKTGIKHFPLTPTLRLLLNQIPPVPGSPFVLADPRSGKPLAYIRKAWRQVRAEAGLPGLHLHDLRHVFGTRSRLTGDLQDAQELLAHRQLATTLRYTHPSMEGLTAVADAVGEWMLGSPSGAPKAGSTDSGSEPPAHPTVQ